MIPGTMLKQLRVSRGLTLEEVGNIVGVGKSTVRKWETGYISNMRSDKLDKLAVALNVSVDYLLGFSIDSQIDMLKLEISQLQAEINDMPNSADREELEQALYFKEESLEDMQLANHMHSQAQSNSSSVEGEELMTILKALSSESKAQLLQYAKFLYSQDKKI